MIEKKEIEFAKEIDDAMVFIIELVKDIKAKKGAAELAAENLPALMAAIGGADQMDDEVEENKAVVAQTVGYRTGELVAAFLGE